MADLSFSKSQPVKYRSFSSGTFWGSHIASAAKSPGDFRSQPRAAGHRLKASLPLGAPALLPQSPFSLGGGGGQNGVSPNPQQT